MKRDGTLPIDDYGLIGDTRTAALVATDGSIDWMPLPRFDSAPVFGRLVGGARAGNFTTGPDEPATLVARRYRGDTTSLETTWAVEGGRLVLTDTMVSEVSGSMLPDHLLVRRLVSKGRPIQVEVELAPRFGYERRRARHARRQSGALLIDHADLALAVTTDGPYELTPDRRTVFELTPGRPMTIVLSAAHRSPLFLVPPVHGAQAAEEEQSRWQHWADELVTGPHHRSALVRSLITLQLLTYSPSGAPVAAPTTSLPEKLGGIRNWDYRYAWPRDASLGISAFLNAGKDEEALRFLAWLLHASRLHRPKLPALFSLDGRPAPRERDLEDWPGYADSRPVRVGNAARNQHQLDVYGWVLDAAWQVTRTGHPLDTETWRTMKAFTEQVSRTWTEPDAGIWERRDASRHHVHSKLMAWLALDRAIRIGRRRANASRMISRWESTRGNLSEEIRSRGFNPEVGAYTGTYESMDLDSSLLLLPWTGFEPQDSARVTSTIQAIRQSLGAGGPLLYRYRDADGLGGSEGAFLPCSFWLVQALALTGRRGEAEAIFEELLGLATGTGLFGEEMDPNSHAHLGNYPQALTHAALLQAASSLRDRSQSQADFS